MEPFDSNLSQAEYYKLMTYNKYIVQKGLSKSNSLDAIYDGISSNLGEAAAREYRFLLGLFQGMLERPTQTIDLDNADNEELFLPKNPVEPEKTKGPHAPAIVDPWEETKNTTGLISDMKQNAEAVLKSWSVYEAKLDKTIPKKKSIPLKAFLPTHDRKYPAPVYWNSENDFRRLEIFYLHKSLELGGIQENIKKQVEENKFPRVKPGKEAEEFKKILDDTYNALPAELHEKHTKHNPGVLAEGFKALSLEQEQTYILQCLQMLGSSEYFRTDLIAEAYGQASLYDPWMNSTTTWIEQEKKKIVGMQAQAKKLSDVTLTQYQSDLEILNKPEKTAAVKLSQKITGLEKEINDIDEKIERYKIQGKKSEIEAAAKEKGKLEKQKWKIELRHAVASGQSEEWIAKTEAKIKRTQNDIAQLNLKVQKSGDRIKEKEARLKSARKEKEDFSTDAQKRGDLRNKVYEKMMSLIKARVEVFTDLTGENHLHDKDGQPAPDNMTDDQAFAWLERQGKGQADYYHWILSLDKSLAAMSVHNSIDNIMSDLSKTQELRADMDSFMENHIDEKYREQSGLKSFMMSIAGDEEAHKILMDQRQKQHDVMREKANKWDKEELRLMTLIDKKDDEINKAEKEMKDAERFINGAQERLDEIPAIRKDLELFDSLRDLRQDQLKFVESHKFISKYNYLNKHFVYNDEKNIYEKRPEVSLKDVEFTEAGSPIKQTTADKFATFVNARFAILQEMVKVENASLRGDDSAAIEECKDNLLTIFHGFNKLFSVEQRPEDKEAAKLWDADKKRHDENAKIAGAAPYGVQYGYKGDAKLEKAHNDRLQALQDAETKTQLYAAMASLLMEAQPFVNRFKTLFELELGRQKKYHDDYAVIEKLKKGNDVAVRKIQKDLAQLDPKDKKYKSKEAALQKQLTDEMMDSAERNQVLADLSRVLISDSEKEYMINVFDVLHINVQNIDEILFNPDKLADEIQQAAEAQRKFKETNDSIEEAIKKSESSEKTLAAIEKYKAENPGIPNEDLQYMLDQEVEQITKQLGNAKKVLKRNVEKYPTLLKEKSDLEEEKDKKAYAYNKERRADQKIFNNFDEKRLEKERDATARRSIVSYEIPTLKGKFDKLRASYEKARDRIYKEMDIRDASDLYRYVDPETKKIDLDKDNHFSGKTRKDILENLRNYYRDARKTKRWFKKSDSQEYVDMMNALAEIIGAQKYKVGHEEPMEPNNLLNITSKDVKLETVVERLELARSKAQAYIDAKESEVRLSPSQMRLDRLKAANLILRDTKTALDLLQGYSVKGSAQKTGGLIGKIRTLNYTFNQVIKPFGDPEKDREAAKEKANGEFEMNIGGKIAPIDESIVLHEPKTDVDKFVDSIPFEKWEEIENKEVDKFRKIHISGQEKTKAMENDKLLRFYDFCVQPTVNEISRKAGSKNLYDKVHFDKRTAAWLSKRNAEWNMEMVEETIGDIKDAIHNNGLKPENSKGQKHIEENVVSPVINN